MGPASKAGCAAAAAEPIAPAVAAAAALASAVAVTAEVLAPAAAVETVNVEVVTAVLMLNQENHGDSLLVLRATQPGHYPYPMHRHSPHAQQHRTNQQLSKLGCVASTMPRNDMADPQCTRKFIQCNQVCF